MSVTVTGGTDGITARIDDLLAMSNLLRAGALAVADARAELAAPALLGQLAEAAGHELLMTLDLRLTVAGLAGPFGPLVAAQAGLNQLADGVRWAAGLYHDADHGILHSILGAIGHAIRAEVLLDIGDFSGARDEFYRTLPGMADLAMIGVGPFEAAFAAALPDGHAVLHDVGPDESVIGETAPHSLAELIGALAWRDGARHGEISVSFVHGADGRRRAIVDIPGTKSWDPFPNHDVTSVGTDVRALAGRDTSYEDGVFDALSAAGVGPDEEVMLVGHSEGGIVAVDAARDATVSGRFRVTHVVTAGSPVGRIAQRLPDSVQLLALENAADVVPHLDGADNPDRPNITTATVDDEHDDVGKNHDLYETYQPAAAAADASGNASIEGFTRSARGFLHGTAMHTHAYRITRGF
jgi:hypothetical protein